MDWYSIPFEPNLTFVLELKEDLKNKYFEQHEKAKHTLEKFSYSLQDVFHKHQKLLADNIELSITNEKLNQIINKHESKQQKISAFNDNQSAQILESSANYNLQIPNNIADFNESIDKKIDKKGVISEKQNINIMVPISSSNFNSDDESEIFQKCKSPSPTIVHNPVKVHNSPILCTRKRLTSKKNLLTSNILTHSINSNSDSKNSLSNTVSIEKNIDEIKNKSHKEFEKENNNNESWKTVENTFPLISENTQNKTECFKTLSYSKTHYGKTEFTETGKRLRQTKLTLEKIVPIIDVSKIDYKNENLSGENDIKCRADNIGKETFSNSNSENINQEKHNKKKQFNVHDTKKEPLKLKNVSTNKPIKTVAENQNISLKDNDLIEISPTQNNNSKLRNKLNLNKKLPTNKITVKTLSTLNNEKIINFQHDTKNHQICKNYSGSIENASKLLNFSEYTIENSFIVTEKNKKFENQKTLNDETYFSPAEKSDSENCITDYNINSYNFEDEIKCRTPPAKKMLLNSFDLVPDRKTSPDYVYKEAVVRNKNEKAKLPGWCCRDCEKWYAHLSEEERQNRRNKCSKHRGKYKADILTPESFWNPVFEDTINSSSFQDD